MRLRKTKSRNKELKEECDALWSDLIKHRANWKSEISGRTEKLHSHHLRGKSNYRLRYDLDNGVCCTSGEHFYGFHVAGRREQYEQIIALKRRKDIFTYLDGLRWQSRNTSLINVKLYLLKEMEKYVE